MICEGRFAYCDVMRVRSVVWFDMRVCVELFGWLVRPCLILVVARGIIASGDVSPNVGSAAPCGNGRSMTLCRQL